MPCDGSTVEVAVPLAQRQRMLKKAFGAGELVAAECQGAMLVREQCLGGVVSGRFDCLQSAKRSRGADWSPEVDPGDTAWAIRGGNATIPTLWALARLLVCPYYDHWDSQL